MALALDEGTGESLRVRARLGLGLLPSCTCVLPLSCSPRPGQPSVLPNPGPHPAKPCPPPPQGGYTTPAQVSRSWLLSVTEWVTQPLAGAPKALWRGNKYSAGGLRTGATAAHILVMDR